MSLIANILMAVMMLGGLLCRDTFYSEVGTYCPECGTKRVKR